MTSNPIPTSIIEWVKQLGLQDQFTSQQIQSGRVVGKILKIVYPQYNLQLLSSNTAVNRVSNWNNLINQLKKIGVKVNQDQKTKIVNGNHDLVYQILTRVHQYYTKNQKQTQVDISKINPKNQISQSNSLLQLFILAIMKYFNLNPKQSVALLSNQCKYLAHMLVKGLKGQMKPVQLFINELYKNIGLISSFCKNRQNQIFFIRAIKPSLISKSQITSQKGIKILQIFLTPLNNKYQLIKQHFLSTLILAIRRHPQLIQQYLKFTIKVTQYSKDILTMYKSQTNQSELQNIFLTLFTISKQTNQLNKFYEMKGVNQLINKSIENIKNAQMSINSLNLLLIISADNTQILSDPQRGSNFIQNIQQISLSKKSQIYVFIQSLFSFLCIFGKDKNQLAPAIFKILIGKYQNAINQQQCQIYIQNFKDIIIQFPLIPIFMIVQAINTKLQANTLTLKQLQLSFLAKAIQNQNIQIKTILIIYNIVSKLLVQQPTYIVPCTQILIQIIKKYNTDNIILDLSTKLIKVCLAIHFANVKRLSSKRKSVTGSSKIQPQDAIYKAKNLAMEQFIYKIIYIKIQQINKNTQPLICYSLIQVESISKQNGQGLRRIIQLFGNVNQILKKYEIQAKKLQQQQNRKQQSKKSKLKQAAWGHTSTNQSHVNSSNITKNRYNLQSQLQPQNKQRSSSYRSSEQGIKSKKLQTKLDPMIFSSNIGVTNAALKGLQKYQKSYLSKIQKIQQQQIKKKQQQDRKDYLKRIFQRKLVQKGLDIKKTKDQQYKYLYQFGVKQKQLQSDTIKHGIQLSYYIPQDEEQRDIKALEYTMKKYQKILKLYYNTYSGHLKAQNLQSFDQMAQKFNLLYSTNIIKLFKDNLLDQFISSKQIQFLAKKINVNLNKKFDDATALDYQGFEQFIIQSSYVMFTRAPKDLRGRPISQMIQQTISRFKLYASDNKINYKLFQDPDIHFTNQTEAIKQINKKLETNPDYILPQGYKKITQKKVIFTHRIFLDAMSQQYKDVYQVIDQLINGCIGVHIIEPFTTYQTIAKARPMLYSTKQRADADVNNQRLSIFMKKQVSKIPIKDREIGKQVAGVLDQIIEAVQFGHQRIGQKLENKVIKDKKQIQEQQNKRDFEERKKWAERDRQVKSALVKHKEVLSEKQKQEKLKKAQDKRKQQQEKKKKEEQQKRLKQKVQNYQNKKKQDEERRKKQQAQQKRKQKQDLQKKKKQSQEIKKKIQQAKLKKQQEEKQKKKIQQAAQKQRKEQQKKKQEQEQKRKKQLVEQYKNKKSQIIENGQNTSNLLKKVENKIQKSLDSSPKSKISVQKKK